MKVEKLEELLIKGIDTLYTQGVCIGKKKEKVLYEKNFSHNQKPFFDLASVSKLFTTTFVLQAVSENKLALTDTLFSLFLQNEKELPSIVKEKLKEITVQEALLHRSGLPAWYPFYTGDGFWATLKKALEKDHREKSTLYSDLNFILLGKGIEHIYQKTLAEKLEGLNQWLGTKFSYNPTNKSQCVPTEKGNQIEEKMCKERGLQILPTPSRPPWRENTTFIQGEVNDGNAYYAFSGMSGHAGIFGTGEDLVTFGQAYLKSLQGKGFLPQKLAAMATSNLFNGRGLGFDTGEVFPHGAGHTGFTGTALYLCPEKELTVALLTSRLALPGPPNLQPFRKEVFTTFYHLA